MNLLTGAFRRARESPEFSQRPERCTKSKPSQQGTNDGATASVCLPRKSGVGAQRPVCRIGHLRI